MEKPTYVLKSGVNVFNLTSDSVRLLDLLITNEEDEGDFINILMNSEDENMAVRELRVHKILNRQMTLDEFLTSFAYDGLKGLIELFMHPINEHEFLRLTNKINDGKISLITLFNRHKQQPRVRFLRLIH